MLLMHIAPGFISLHVTPRSRDTADNGCRATNGVRLGLILRILLSSNLADLVQVALEHGGVGNILCRLGQLQQDHSTADLEEAHDDSCNLDTRALESLKQNGRSDDRRAGERDVVRRRDEGSVENIERFLWQSLAQVFDNHQGAC